MNQNGTICGKLTYISDPEKNKLPFPQTTIGIVFVGGKYNGLEVPQKLLFIDLPVDNREAINKGLDKLKGKTILVPGVRFTSSQGKNGRTFFKLKANKIYTCVEEVEDHTWSEIDCNITEIKDNKAIAVTHERNPKGGYKENIVPLILDNARITKLKPGKHIIDGFIIPNVLDNAAGILVCSATAVSRFI